MPSKATVLFADNDADFLKTRAEFLEHEGYDVLLATNPTEARRLLEAGGIDLAILDIRLVADDDEKDTSGLVLAKEYATSVPKIILTGFPSYEYVRRALRKQKDGWAAAQDFVSKYEGPEAMLRSMQNVIDDVSSSRLRHARSVLVRVLGIGGAAQERAPLSEERHLMLVPFDIPAQLKRDYDEVVKQVILNHRARLVLTVLGILIMMAGVVGALAGQVAVGLLTASSGVIAELIGVLLAKFGEDANRRMDQYHKELVLFYKRIGKTK